MEQLEKTNSPRDINNLKSRPRKILRYVIKKHLKSQKYAWRGLFEIIRNQMNFQIELFMASMAVLGGILFGINPTEWMILCFTIMLVLISEAFNSSVEAMCDALSKEDNENIRYAKDVAAGAVLLSAILAIIIGTIIFTPYIYVSLMQI